MLNFLTHLYEMDAQNNECNPATVPSREESELYDELTKRLPKEDLQTLNAFLELYATRLEQERELCFKKGFRYAVRFIIESFNEKF